MPTNHAAWLVDNKSRPLEVREAPYAPPGAHEIVVKNGAVGINPIDYGKQLSGDKLFNWIKYPFILGLDLAGEVVEVGKDVTNVEPGDRVLGMAAGMDKRVNRSCEGAFQEYTIVRDYVVSPIPDDLPLHRLKDVVAFLRTKEACAGAVAIGDGSVETCIDIVSKAPPAKGSGKCKFVARVSIPIDMANMPKGGLAVVAFFLVFLWWTISTSFKARIRGVKTKFVEAKDPSVEELLVAIFRDFLPEALRRGSYVASPEPLVAGKGLEYVQNGFVEHRKGVSMKKVVVEL